MALRQRFNQPIPQCVINEWFLACVLFPKLYHRGSLESFRPVGKLQCFCTKAKCWQSSLFAVWSAQWFIPSENVDMPSVGMTKTAAQWEKTPLVPVVGSSRTWLTTTSPWSPGNFLEFLSCSFSSLWDTLSREPCAQDPDRIAPHPTDTQLPQYRKSRLWRSAQGTVRWIQPHLLNCPPTMNAKVCRHMKRRCGMGAEESPNPLWCKLLYKGVNWVERFCSTTELI